MTWHDMIASLDQSFCEVVLLIVYLFITRITISQSLEGGRSYSWADPVNFDKGDLLLVAPWFGLSSFSALMYPSTQVDKCWYGDWIYIGLVAGGGTQQSLFYWKIYDPLTWRYSGWLSLSHISWPPSGHHAVLHLKILSPLLLPRLVSR